MVLLKKKEAIERFFMPEEPLSKEAKSKKTCSILIANNCPYDRPTKYAGLGFRMLLTAGSWVVLCMSSDSTGFFSTLLLFYMNLACDYHKFIPDTKWRQRIKTVGITFSYFFVFIAVIGLMGIIQWKVVGEVQFLSISEKMLIWQGFSIKLENLLYVSLVSIFLTVVDWAIYDGVFVSAMQEEERSGRL